MKNNIKCFITQKRRTNAFFRGVLLRKIRYSANKGIILPFQKVWLCLFKKHHNAFSERHNNAKRDVITPFQTVYLQKKALYRLLKSQSYTFLRVITLFSRYNAFWKTVKYQAFYFIFWYMNDTNFVQNKFTFRLYCFKKVLSDVLKQIARNTPVSI